MPVLLKWGKKDYSTTNKKLSISQPFEELYGWNSELKLIMRARRALTGQKKMVVILDFIWISISQVFEELQGLNFELKLIRKAFCIM